MIEDTPLSPQRDTIADEVAGGITRVEELAYELKVSQVMSSDVKAVAPDDTMDCVLRLVQDQRVSGAPVVASGKLVGVVSTADLLRAMQDSELGAPVSRYMTDQPVTVGVDDLVIRALELFEHTTVSRLPVVDSHSHVVGIVTKGDITNGVLRALRSDYQREEVRRYRASHLFEDIDSDRTSLILRYRVKPRDFRAGGTASVKIRRALTRLGASPPIARRCAVAACEAEMNLVIHTTNGGILRVEVEPHLIYMEALDDGPGIEDVERAKQPGFSTASEEARALGFGAGFGLTNISRCVDKMWLESTVGKGTRLEMWIYLQSDAPYRRLDSILERLSFGAR
ncbi:MAG: CBS domain-containing protein [Anaerolineales bacterium]|nr:CBS domain-containing protein [Anaerolineales bacterium]